LACVMLKAQRCSSVNLLPPRSKHKSNGAEIVEPHSTKRHLFDASMSRDSNTLIRGGNSTGLTTVLARMVDMESLDNCVFPRGLEHHFPRCIHLTLCLINKQDHKCRVPSSELDADILYVRRRHCPPQAVPAASVVTQYGRDTAFSACRCPTDTVPCHAHFE